MPPIGLYSSNGVHGPHRRAHSTGQFSKSDARTCRLWLQRECTTNLNFRFLILQNLFNQLDRLQLPKARECLASTGSGSRHRAQICGGRDLQVVEHGVAYQRLTQLRPLDSGLGRVVGYDNSHGDHHRHFAGAEEKFAFISYEGLLERFLNEVRELRQKKEPI